MKYVEITEEQKKRIENLFDISSLRETDFNYGTDKEGYYITVKQMYRYVTFKDGTSTLKAMMEIANILECEDGDEVSRHSYGGCSTCDYGSSYILELRFW